jgi:CRISPR/Cas system-associated endonuclease Cas1
MNTVDSVTDKYEEREIDEIDNEKREEEMRGMTGALWRVYYWIV